MAKLPSLASSKFEPADSIYTHVLRPGLTQLTPVAPVATSTLRSSFDEFEMQLKRGCDQAKFAAQFLLDKVDSNVMVFPPE